MGSFVRAKGRISASKANEWGDLPTNMGRSLNTPIESQLPPAWVIPKISPRTEKAQIEIHHKDSLIYMILTILLQGNGGTT